MKETRRAYALSGPEVAFTLDEYNALRNLAPRADPILRTPARTDNARVYQDENHEELRVTFVREALLFVLAFRGATALLNLNNARDLAGALTTGYESRH